MSVNSQLKLQIVSSRRCATEILTFMIAVGFRILDLRAFLERAEDLQMSYFVTQYLQLREIISHTKLATQSCKPISLNISSTPSYLLGSLQLLSVLPLLALVHSFSATIRNLSGQKERDGRRTHLV